MPCLRRVLLIMRLFTSALSLALLSCGFLVLAGCSQDNEVFIREQKARVKGTIPGATGAHAKTLEEFYEVTPGAVGGAGTRIGPVPDQGKGYPGAKP